MAKKKVEELVWVDGSPGVEAEQLMPGGIVYATPTQAELDLKTLVEAQKIRRDPARFMAAKALPAAQKHYIV